MPDAAGEESKATGEKRSVREHLGDGIFRLMVDAVKDYGIFLLDPDGYVASWNEGAERIKGYAAEEIIGQHFSIFYPPEALAKDWPEFELEAARREGRFEDEGWRTRKDGSRFWANVVITALRGEDGRLIGFTKVTRDLTERRRQEEALRWSEKKLERAYLDVTQKNNDLEDFAYVASHDLQEPLRKVLTFAGLLEDEYQDQLDETARHYLDRMRTSAQRMSKLISDLLAYSRVATSSHEFEPVDLNEVVDDVSGDLQILLSETEGRVEHEVLPTIEADPTQMRQLFQNLIGNALKFHEPGVSPLVRITNGASSDEIGVEGEVRVIEVSDRGIGFEPENADLIFAPLRRLHTQQEFAGTGLGLAICKRIVERHGGTISARSHPGDGATFTIVLPVEGPTRALLH